MGSLLYSIIIYPLELLIEFVFIVTTKGFSNIGVAIAGISVFINLLTLPLYVMADNLQKEERDTRIRLKPEIDKIKAVFKGDEQYMILSTFYKQNHYHPVYALRSSLSLLIQIPFFIAAYHFLYNLDSLQGLSFLFIPNMGKPDGLLSIGSFSINLLPILMVLLNIIAGSIYSKGFPLHDKIQIYLMAGLFLVLLYNSPAGLVYYWTLNNIFSLVKNIFYKVKHPLKVLYVFLAGAVIIGSVVIIFINASTITPIKIGILVVGSFIMIALPLFLRIGDRVYGYFLSAFADQKKIRNTLFFLSCVLLWLLCGLIIPSNLIASSPIEFSNTGAVGNPLGYISETLLAFFGIWCFWPGSIYLMFGKKTKAVFSFVAVGFSVSALLNVFVFGGKYGVITNLLQFQDPDLLNPSALVALSSLLVTFLCFLGCAFLLQRKHAVVLNSILSILILTSLAGGSYTSIIINSAYKTHQKNLASLDSMVSDGDELQSFYHLSPEGKNVVVFFLDRAINSYFPLILEQFPEIENQYKGFVYYPNTVSFGGHTVTGMPPIFGGYEYTPDAMNKRNTEKLVDKHNESMLVLPKMFLDAGYDVTVTDPPFSNYQWAADLTPFTPYPQVKVGALTGAYTDRYKQEYSQVIDATKISRDIIRYLPFFSLMKIALPLFRPILYDEGHYVKVRSKYTNIDIFLDSYAQLYYMDKLVDYEGDGNTYTFIGNESTHSPSFLQASDYLPMSQVTDTDSPLSSFSVSDLDVASYHVNAVSLKTIGLWLEKLQRDGMYDNTRIIIVADHGFNLFSPVFSQFSDPEYYACYNPLLLVKDFNVQGSIQIDDTFMTNADVPLLALENLGIVTRNPFTGNDLYSAVDKQVVHAYETDYQPSDKTTFEFDYNMSYAISDDITEESNWKSILH